MKNAFCYMVLLVLVMSVMVSCEEKATYTMAEAVEPQAQPATDHGCLACHANRNIRRAFTVAVVGDESSHGRTRK